MAGERSLWPAEGANEVAWSGDGRPGTVDWAYLYECHALSLRRLIARRLPRGGPVEDVLQDTFARAIRSTHLVDTARPPWPFLATVAGRAVADWWEREGARQLAADPVDDVADDYPGSDEHAIALDRLLGTRRALLALKPRHRRALYLYAGADCSYEQLVELDRVSAKAVKSLLGRARARFQEYYREAALGVLVWTRVTSARVRDRLERLTSAPLAAEGVSVLGSVVAVGLLAGVTVLPSTSATMATRGADAASATPAPTMPVAESIRRPEAEQAPIRSEQRRMTESQTMTGQPPSASQRPALAVDTGQSLTNEPEESTVSYEIAITDPFGLTHEKVGMTTRCNEGEVAARKCQALRLLPDN